MSPFFFVHRVQRPFDFRVVSGELLDKAACFPGQLHHRFAGGILALFPGIPKTLEKVLPFCLDLLDAFLADRCHEFTSDMHPENGVRYVEESQGG